MPTPGDTAVLRFGNDNKWHWFFLTPQASSMLGFDGSVVATTDLISLFGTAAQGAKADSALQNAAAFATAAQGVKADSALQSQLNADWSSGSGASQVLNKPALGTQMAVDSGWTANSTEGDKSAVLASYSNGLNSTIISALNLAAANSGTVLSLALDVIVLLVKKVAALETALVAGKLPNA